MIFARPAYGGVALGRGSCGTPDSNDALAWSTRLCKHAVIHCNPHRNHDVHYHQSEIDSVLDHEVDDWSSIRDLCMAIRCP